MDASSNQKQKLPSVSMLSKSAWNKLKAGLGTYVGFIIFPLVVVIPLIIVIAVWAVGTYSTEPDSTVNIIIGVICGVLALICLVGMIIVQYWAYAAMILKAGNEKLKFKEALREAKKYLKSLIFAGIVSTLVMFGGFVLLIIPGIIISVWFFAVMFVVIYENHKGMNALLRSKQLIRGYWWAVFGRMLAVTVIYVVVVMVLNLLTFGIGGSIVNIFFFPFLLIYSFEIYSSLKSVKKAEPLDQEKGKKAFTVLAIIGLILTPIMIGAALYQAWTDPGLYQLDDTDSQWEYSQDDYDYYSEDSLDDI